MLDDVVVDDEGRGSCPSCGLGWTESPLLVSTQRTVVPGAEARRRQQALGRIDAQRREAVARCSFPVYGLDGSWTGRRWLGGWGGHDGGLDRLELAHGDAWDENAALVRITTWGVEVPLRRQQAAHTLAQSLWHETGTRSEAMASTFSGEDPTASWLPLALPVDGDAVPFRSLSAGPRWVALGEIGSLLVGLTARNIAPADVALVTIPDPTVYLADDGSPG